MTTTSDIIGKRLYDAGCRHAFGIPGGEVLSLMDGLGKAGIAFHLVKHENAGGFMAEGTYHATGAPGTAAKSSARWQACPPGSQTAPAIWPPP